MRKKYLLLLLAALVTVTSFSFAQENDSTDYRGDADWNNNHWWNRWDDNDWFDWEFKGTPFVEVNFGLGNFKRKNMGQDLAKLGDGELKLGYSNRENYSDERTIEFSDKYFFISRIGSDMESTTARANELRARMWRFGFAKRNGYGYKLGNLFILPYYTRGIVWSRLQMIDYPPNVFTQQYPQSQSQISAMADRDIIDRYDEEFRFGTIHESGINFDIASTIGFNVGYESSVIFPRHLFWKHMGSWAIQEVGMGLLNHFIDEVADSSPLSAPLVNFILKGAYSYAFYSLQKDKMNWPFDTETPLTFETVKFGVTFTF
jgi:hypothetical protein